VIELASLRAFVYKRGVIENLDDADLVLRCFLEAESLKEMQSSSSGRIAYAVRAIESACFLAKSAEPDESVVILTRAKTMLAGVWTVQSRSFPGHVEWFWDNVKSGLAHPHRVVHRFEFDCGERVNPPATANRVHLRIQPFKAVLFYAFDLDAEVC
jgi:hypothetical protein